jgi:hypothetical protein
VKGGHFWKVVSKFLTKTCSFFFFNRDLLNFVLLILTVINTASSATSQIPLCRRMQGSKTGLRLRHLQLDALTIHQNITHFLNFWNIHWSTVPRRLFFAAQQRIAITLKVVTNEKWRGSRSWQVFEGCTNPWRSMSVYLFKKLSSFLQHISVSCL